MRLQSAIFDMDGTLLDSMPIWRDLGTSVLRGRHRARAGDQRDAEDSLSLRHGIAYCKEHYHLPDGGGADQPGSGPGRGFLSA
ncbi:MAG: hypothetical protein ACLTYN_02505 [Dysosmobacter welbionis]